MDKGIHIWFLDDVPKEVMQYIPLDILARFYEVRPLVLLEPTEYSGFISNYYTWDDCWFTVSTPLGTLRIRG